MRGLNAFVVGGTGGVGSLLVDMLVKNKYHVSATFRKAADQANIEKLGAKAVQLDLAKSTPEQLTDELTGFDHIFFTAGSGGKDVWNVDRDGAVKVCHALSAMASSSSNGIISKKSQHSKNAHYIVLSSIGVHKPEIMGDLEDYGKAKKEADDLIWKDQIKKTIIRPGALTDDKETGKIIVNGGTGGMPEVSLIEKTKKITNTRADVARTMMEAAKIFNNDEESRLFEMINGNDDLDPGMDIAKALETLSKPVVDYDALGTY